MPSIECAICSEEFGKRNDSSDVVVTPCGHCFHEMCLSKWLQHGLQSAEPKTCPECRQAVTISQTRRIYFNFSCVIDNVQAYVEYLDSVITTKNNKLHMATMQLEKIKLDWTSKLREKDHEIQRLHDKLKHREQDYEVQKLHARIEKLKSKLRETRHKHTTYPKVTMGGVQMNLNENIGMHPSQFNTTETMNAIHPMNSMRTTLIQPNNCDVSTSIFNQNIYGGQSSGTSTTTIQNPFDCDISTINSNLRSIRNPLSTFAPSYQSQNGYMSTNPMQTFNAMMNPIQSTHTTQTTQQQTISYNQTSFFLPIQTTNSINATYFNTNDQSHQNHQNHFIGQ